MVLRRPIAVAASALVVLAAGLPPAPAGATPGLTAVDKVFALAHRSLLRLGVYHVRTATTTTIGSVTDHGTGELWADVARGVDRSVAVQRPAVGRPTRYRALLAHHVQWDEGQPSSPVTCFGTDAVTAAVVDCQFSEAKPNVKVVQGRYHGRPALVLVAHLVGGGSDALSRTTRLTYLDPATALPLSSVETGTYSLQKTLPLRRTTSYRTERLSRSRLPQNFFDPAALGWKLPDPLADLPHGIPVYWPGRTWAPGGHLPTITLQHVDRLPAAPYPRYQEILEYARASDPFGPIVLTLQIWTAADWARAKVEEPIPLCKPVSHVALALGTATFHCPSPGPDAPYADIDPPGAHLLIGAPSTEGAGHLTRSPFGTIAAYTTVINALQVRA